jgi:hypothetical protein
MSNKEDWYECAMYECKGKHDNLCDLCDLCKNHCCCDECDTCNTVVGRDSICDNWHCNKCCDCALTISCIQMLCTKWEGHDICIECGNKEIPTSEMDGGEIGLTDYYFTCADCHWSWYVAVRTDEYEDGPSVGFTPEGWFYGKRGACDGCYLCEDDEDYHLKVLDKQKIEEE